MKTLNFIDFYLRSILEDVNGDKLPLYYSGRFRFILYKIDDEISRKLISFENKDIVKSTKTYIDIDEESNDKISFIMVNKIKDALGIDKDNDSFNINLLDNKDSATIFSARQRATMKINRFINEISNNDYVAKTLSEEDKEYNKSQGIKTNAQKLEEFVNKFKALRAPAKFELVKGDDIVYWYNQDNYSSREGVLGNSCMSHSRCADYLQFYAKNPSKVSLLIIKDRSDDSKISGRALVWNLDKPSGRIFMDRTYTVDDFDIQSFRKYATENGWLYRSDQAAHYGSIIDSVTGEKISRSLDVKMKDNDTYPYMDTMMYYDGETLSSYEIGDNIKTLQDTYGGYEGGNQHSYDELVDMYIDEIMNDFEYYAKNYFPEMVWDHVDDDSFMEGIISSESDYFYDDFESVIEEDEIIRYIRDNWDNLKNVSKYVRSLLRIRRRATIDDLDELDKDQAFELVDKLDIKFDIATEHAHDRYDNMSAKEYFEEMYGDRAVENFSDGIYDVISNYIDEDACAREYAENEGEYDLRERFER